MISSPQDIYQKFEQLRQDYKQQLPSKVEQLEELWQTILKKITSTEDWATMHCLTHRLVGSSATFGFHGLSETAHTLECCLKDIVDSGTTVTLEQQAIIQALLETVKLAAHNPFWEPHQKFLLTTNRNLACIAEKPIKPKEISSQIQSIPARSQPSNANVCLVSNDSELIQDLAAQLSFFGYRVHHFKCWEEFKVYAGQCRLEDQDSVPAAIIADLALADKNSTGIEIISQIYQFSTHRPPVLFISTSDDLNTRLQAVRAGGVAYFTKPVDIGSLIDKLDTFTSLEDPEPGRILIVEDESILATYYAAFLQQAGMMTLVVTDPMQVMQPLVEFKPDLILMDMYMPGCSGLELAAVIRQQDAYVSIPIVFLSIETDVEQQLAAINLGGDEFLTKPIDPTHLVSEVKSRVERSRILSSFMVKDSLTGLLNHTKIKEQLYLEVARAQRQQIPLAFAMIDIDHFKSINDAFGHLIGDRVIRSLARLLQQRLRKTDIIGRYGGEEFAIIFPNTSAFDATRVLEEIRTGFSQVRQQANEHEFSVTFSGGVAGFPDYKDPNSLNEAADQMLYQAKRSGRNQVMQAFITEIGQRPVTEP